MKNTLKNRALSVILAVLMLVSAFAVCIPASAATASETLENAFGKVLWSADFDYEAATASGTATRNLLAAPTNGDSKLNLWSGGGASTGINVSAALTGSALQFVGATYPADCTQGHSKPVIQESYSVEGYKDVYKVKCECCGQIYYTYDKLVDTVFDYDFTTMTAAEFAEAKSTYKFIGSTFVEGKGLENVNEKGGRNGIWASTKSDVGTGPVIVNMDKPYEIGFTVNFSSFPKTKKGQDPTGVSFFTDVTTKYNMLLRMGTHDIDGVNTKEASTTKAWVKTRGAGGSTDWANPTATPSCMYLDLNTDYKFVIKVNGSKYDVYVGTTLLGSSSFDFGSIDERSYRIGDARESLKFMLKDWYVKSEYDEYAPEIYDIFDETMASEGFRGVVNGNMLPQANETAGFYVGNKLGVDASNNIWDDKLALDEGSFALNFDFMLPENGKVNTNPSSSGDQFWSLLSWVTGINSATADNGCSAILSVGALDTNRDGTFDKHFLVPGKEAAIREKILVSADNATVEQKKNQSIEISGTTYYYIDDASIYDLTVGEWVNISLSFDTCANMMSIYVNGEHVWTKYSEAASDIPDVSASTSLLRSYLRFGDGFSGRFKYAWALRDVELVPDAGFFGNHSGSPAYVMDFGSADCTLKSNISENVFGTHNANDKYTQVLDSETAQGYTKYKVSSVANLAGGTSRMMDVVKSTKNRFTGEFVDVLSSDGSKYSIDVTFAIPDRALTADEITALSAKYKDLAEGSTMRQLLAHVSYSILRLSKWSDANQIRLLYHNDKGMFNALSDGEKWFFCNKAGEIYKAFSELDESGRPLAMTNVKAVVDEWNNTYTLYINGELAYRKQGVDGTNIIPAADMPMRVQTNSGSLLNSATYSGTNAAYAAVFQNAPAYEAWVDSGKAYAAIPHDLTATLEDGTSKTFKHGGKATEYRDISYIRFFQTSYEYIVEEIKLEKIKDSDVEYVGSQVKLGTEADTTFDLRFVFGVDDLYANGISYHVTAKVDDLVKASEGKETDVDANVYSSIIAGGKKVNAYEYFEGEYFSVFKVEGVKVSTADTLYTFTITPYVTSASGTKVATGEVYTVQYNGIGQYVGCPVDTPAE